MVFGHDTFGINTHVFHAAGTEADFTGDKVKIFEHCMEDTNFTTGWSMELGEGEYDKETFDPEGKNDSISAIWIPEGYTVVAHQNYIDDDTTGTTWTHYGPKMIKCLAEGSGAANDQISYLKITKDNGEDCAGCEADPIDGFEPAEDINWWLYGGIAVVTFFAFSG